MHKQTDDGWTWRAQNDACFICICTKRDPKQHRPVQFAQPPVCSRVCNSQPSNHLNQIWRGGFLGTSELPILILIQNTTRKLATATASTNPLSLNCLLPHFQMLKMSLEATPVQKATCSSHDAHQAWACPSPPGGTRNGSVGTCKTSQMGSKTWFFAYSSVSLVFFILVTGTGYGAACFGGANSVLGIPPMCSRGTHNWFWSTRSTFWWYQNTLKTD